MRALLSLAAALTLAACQTMQEAGQPPDSLCGPETYVGACVAGKLALLPVAAVLVGLGNTSVYSSTVRTDHGTYDATSACTFGSCDTTVRKR